MVGVAVKVTEVLGQIEVTGVVMLTDGVTLPLMVIVIELEAAVAGDAQAELEVRIHVTTCPFVRVVVV